VAPRYHFGSFDDDAGYVLAAKALLHGAGLTGTLSDGRPLIGYYPPGFAAVLAPVIAVFGTSVTPLRVVSTVAYGAIFPATWWLLARCGVGRPTRVAVLLVVALNPVLATFGSMVMAETTFVALFMVWLVVVRHYDANPQALGADAAGVILLGAGLVWCKEAALGMVAGLVAWFLLRRMWRKAVAVSAGVGALLAPVVIARLIVGVPVTGARYSQEFGQFYQGGWWHRVVYTVPQEAWSLLIRWLPLSVVPDGSPIPQAGWEHYLFETTGMAVPILSIIGAVACWRRYRDPSVVIVALYLVEVALYPFVNERRTVLFLPVLVLWFVVGAVTVGRWVMDRASAALSRRAGSSPRRGQRGARGRRWPTAAGVAGALVAGAVVAGAVVLPLTRQIHRDYLFALDQSSSQPDGSPYMALLRALGQPRDVVETDYVSSVALLSGHRGDDTAFVAANGSVPGQRFTCVPTRELADIEADHAAFLLTAALNKPVLVDSDCLLVLAASDPWAVRLMTTSVDGASVFEIIGPGSVHPDLVDLTARGALHAPDLGATPLGPQGVFDNPGNILTTPTVNGVATLTWTWPSPVSITQVSVGGAAVEGTTGVEVQEQRPDGGWVTVAAAAGPVGDGGVVPFLLASSPDGTPAIALRVLVRGQGSAGVVDVRALGHP